jgi:hypothetical protein
MLYTLLSDPRLGFRFPDDNGTLITSKEMTIKINPYAQEPKGPFPLMVVGPSRPLSVSPMSGSGAVTNEIHVAVEVRVAVVSVDIPYPLDGSAARSRMLEGLRLWVLANTNNPDQTGMYDHIRTLDYGRDLSLPTGPPLYKSAMSIEVVWIE